MSIKDEKGFTLVELAVVLIIIGVLSGAFFSFMHVLSMRKKTEMLDSKLDMIRRAISEYIEDDPLDPTDITEMRYPCPASPTAAIGSAEYGVENRVGGVCSATNGVAQAIGTDGQAVFIGAVPTRTLSIGGDYMHDPYYGRFTYAVSGNLTQVNALSGVNSGAITILDEGAVITDRAHFALVSHGEIGTGGYSVEGALLGSCATDNDGDSENCDGDATFIAEQGMTLANTSAFNDDSVMFDLVDDTDDEWWQATDVSGQDINNRNPGNIGIGTANPVSKLDVQGEVRIGNSGLACDANVLGSTRYNAATDAMEYCAANDGSGAPGWTSGLPTLESQTVTFVKNNGNVAGPKSVTCPAGWTATGCGFTCAGSWNDHDLRINQTSCFLGTNDLCLGSNPEIRLTVKCVRLQ